MAKQLQLAVVLRAIDLLSGPLRKAFGAIVDVDRAAARAKGLKSMGDDLQKIGSTLQGIGLVTAGAGLGMAHTLGLTALPGQLSEVSHALRGMANVGNLTESQLASARAEVVALAKATNQTQSDITRGLSTLVAAGMAFDRSMKNMGVIGKTATAATADVDDIARTAFSVIDNLEVRESDLARVMDVLAQSGKEGRFELKNMASAFPALTSAAGMLQMRGVPAVASLGAALQIAMKGAGDPATAANNLQNFLSKLTSPETVRNFAKLGVNLKREMDGAMARGEDPILHMVRLVQRITGGDQFKLGELFGDMQVQNFLKPMLANADEYVRIKEKALGAQGVVDHDFLNMLKEFQEQWKQLKINLAAIVSSKATSWMGSLASLLQRINASPALQKLLLGTVAFLVVGGSLALLFGTLITFAGMTLTNIGALGVGLSALKAGFLGTASGLTGGARVLALIAGGIRTATMATWSWTTALFANPITGWIAGIALAIGLIWTFRRQILAFLDGLDLFGTGARIMGTLWRGMKAMAMKPVELMRWVVQKVRNLLPFSPAKEGPLRDLHRIKLVETVAATMRPGPMVTAMRYAAAATVAAATFTAAPRGRPAAAAPVSIQYSPSVQVIGAGESGAALEATILRALNRHQGEITRIVRREMDLRARGDFRS